MDKLIHDEEKDTTPTTISNNGATIMKLLNIVHPAVNCGVLDLRVFCGMQNCMWKMLSICSA
jgi:hypothetical protein